jgi:hypothetical protein
MHEIINARYIKNYQIELEFKNGKKGIVDFKSYLEKGGVFSRFAEMVYFKKFSINRESGSIEWPNELDIDPDNLYHKATGEPLPVWANIE